MTVTTIWQLRIITPYHSFKTHFKSRFLSLVSQPIANHSLSSTTLVYSQITSFSNTIWSFTQIVGFVHVNRTPQLNVYLTVRQKRKLRNTEQITLVQLTWPLDSHWNFLLMYFSQQRRKSLRFPPCCSSQSHQDAALGEKPGSLWGKNRQNYSILSVKILCRRQHAKCQSNTLVSKGRLPYYSFLILSSKS